MWKDASKPTASAVYSGLNDVSPIPNDLPLETVLLFENNKSDILFVRLLFKFIKYDKFMKYDVLIVMRIGLCIILIFE